MESDAVTSRISIDTRLAVPTSPSIRSSTNSLRPYDWRFLFKDGLQLILHFLDYIDWRNATITSRVWFNVASLARNRKWSLYINDDEDFAFWTHSDRDKSSRWSLKHHINALGISFRLSWNEFVRVLRAAPCLERFDGNFWLNPEESRPSTQVLTGALKHLRTYFGMSNDLDASEVITALIEAFAPSLRSFYLERGMDFEVPLTRLERLETLSINSSSNPPNAWLEQLAALLNQLPQLQRLFLPLLWYSSHFIQRLRLPNLKAIHFHSQQQPFALDATKLLELHAACPVLEKLPGAVFLRMLYSGSMRLPHWATLREVGFFCAPEKLQGYVADEESPPRNLDPQMVLQTELDFVTLLVSCTQITQLSFFRWAPSETMAWKQIGASLIALERLHLSQINYIGDRPFFILDAIDVSLASRLKELRLVKCSLASISTLQRFPNLEVLSLCNCLDTKESIEDAYVAFDDANFLSRLHSLYIVESRADPSLYISFSIPHRENVVKFQGQSAEQNKLHRSQWI